MEELNELIKEIKGQLDVGKPVDDETKSAAIKMVKDADRVLLLASEYGVGYAGSGVKIMSCWATLTLELMNKIDPDGDTMKKAFDLIYSMKDLDEDEQVIELAKLAKEGLKPTKEELKDTRKELEDRLKEIDKELEELKD